MIRIYHNPRCRKSRETLKYIEESGKEFEIIEYLKNPPEVSELEDILGKIELPVGDIIRKNEAVYKEKFKGKDLSEKELIKAIAENPILLERPIVIKGGEAIMGRPPENVRKLL